MSVAVGSVVKVLEFLTDVNRVSSSYGGSYGEYITIGDPYGLLVTGFGATLAMISAMLLLFAIK